MNFSSFQEFSLMQWWKALRKIRIASRSPYLPIKPREERDFLAAFGEGVDGIDLEKACIFADDADDDFDTHGATFQELEDEYGGYDSEGNYTGEYEIETYATETVAAADGVSKVGGTMNANGGFNFGTTPVELTPTATAPTKQQAKDQ